jgi:hypothetical protein
MYVTDRQGPAGGATPAVEATELANIALWDQIAAPSADWARANPGQLMALLMVAPHDFPGLAEMLNDL